MLDGTGMAGDALDMARVVIKSGHSYARRPPGLMNLRAPDPGVYRALLQQLAEPAVECPAEGYTVLEHCYVYDGCYVMTPELEWVPDTVADYGIADIIKPVIQDVIRGRHHSWLEQGVLPTAVIAKSGHENYGHVLTDILPKLIHIGQSGLPGVHLLLPVSMERYGPLVAAVLSHMGVQAMLEFHVPATLREARDVHVFGPVARHNDRKSTTFLALRDVLRQIYGVRGGGTRRLFIRRGGSDYRLLDDGAGVEAAFARHGFETVYPGDLPLDAQIRLFAEASHLAGPMGAGMANMGWADPGCHVLMIDPGMGDTYFWDFACLLGQRFDWLFAAPMTGYTEAAVHTSYGIGMDLLEATLATIYR